MLSSSGRGLGRSLSYVGRNQISLFVMLHAALVHKLPCEAISQAFAWNCRAKAALQNIAELFLKLLHGTVMQKLPFEIFF